MVTTRSKSAFFCYIYLTAKETHIIQYPFNTRKPLSNFTLNDINMFERTHAFVPGHFIRHYIVNYYFLLMNAKKRKTVPYIGKGMFLIRLHCMSREHNVPDKKTA